MLYLSGESVCCCIAPKKRKRAGPQLMMGGYRQQRKFMMGQSGVSSTFIGQTDSALGEVLAYEVLWGFITPVLCQRIAAAAVIDGLRNPTVEKLAGICNKVTFPGKCWRDFKIVWQPLKLVDAIGNFRVSVKLPPTGRLRINLDIVWPHILFATLYREHRQAFIDRICGGGSDCIRSFWEQQRAHPQFTGHHMHNHYRFDYMTHGVALGLHGDGVTCVGLGKKSQKHADVISWTSMLTGSGHATHGIHFLITLVFQHMAIKTAVTDTYDTVWMHIAWSFCWLYQGIYPDRTADGRMFELKDTR